MLARRLWAITLGGEKGVGELEPHCGNCMAGLAPESVGRTARTSTSPRALTATTKGVRCALCAVRSVRCCGGWEVGEPEVEDAAAAKKLEGNWISASA